MNIIEKLAKRKVIAKKVLRDSPRASVVIRQVPQESTFFKSYYDKNVQQERRNILSWK